MSESIRVPIKIHPRAFSAFGEDLITNENVAMIELVKNSYDAYALKVEIKFGYDQLGAPVISITDDGCGMTRDTIENAWATIATFYKKARPYISRTFKIVDDAGKIQTVERTRTVSGNKGLGRFSAARLGHEMHITTKHKDDKCIDAFFDWRSFEQASTINECAIDLSYRSDNVFSHNENETGTTITIRNLRTTWDEQAINNLISELARLINPFEQVNDFSIFVSSRYTQDAVKIKPNEFINRPVYKIEGIVKGDGIVTWTYYHDSGVKKRQESGSISWDAENYGKIANEPFSCGPFSFEIRAWDLDSSSMESLKGRFKIEKSKIRSNISQYKGISVYRDHILVLPKSESSRDWLGLDAKRISRVGDRLSTSQIVGIINISNDDNPGIKDTTDREKLADTSEYRQFTDVIIAIISILQNERSKEKNEDTPKATLTDIISPLSSKALVQDIEQAINEGRSNEAILERVQEYDAQNERQLTKLNERLVYYGQTASLGSVAVVIMHEILTGMTAIKRFLNKAQGYISDFDERTIRYLEDANRSHERLLEVTNSFTPLYRRDLRKKSNYCNLLDCVRNSVRLIKAKKISSDIQFIYGIRKDIAIQMNEGELQTILINLFDNACYWIKESKTDDKRIVIETESEKNGRVTIVVSDTGLGVEPENAEKIFTPGITAKPKGIGMGLVIVTELVNAYNGKVGLRYPGNLHGATFAFDVPMKRGESQ